MQVAPISGALGAEISGVDLRSGLSNQQAADVHAAFLTHHVLFFRDQSMTAEEQLRFTRTFGEPALYPFIQGLPETPEVIEIIKTESDTANFGGSWHSDTSYMPEPALGSVLQGLEVPQAGGDTLFANTAAAYAALSDGMHRLVDGLVGVNSSDNGYGGSRARGMSKLSAMKGEFNEVAKSYESEHPIVRTHPESGIKGLYVSRSHTARFKDMTAPESKPLIDFLASHITRPEFTCRFRWEAGSVAVWDNRVTQHFALNDYAGKRRHMLRVTIKGDRPF